MKKFLLTLVAVTFFFIVGCQENPVTEPIQSFEKRANYTTEGTINLCCVLEDPIGGTCQLTGEVNYIHQVTPIQLGLYEVTLSLNMNSELCKVDNPTMTQWTINCQTTNVFNVSEEGIYILEKYYIVENRIDILLIVQYLVTTEGVGIPNLWLQEID